MTTGLVPQKTDAGALSRQARLGHASEHIVFGLLPIVATAALVVFQFHIRSVAIDLRVAYWPAARHLVQGLPLYSPNEREIAGGAAFVYPPLAAVVFTPFTLLSRDTAQAVYMVVGIACVPATLRVLQVRDWRLYGVAMLWSPIFLGWEIGNVTLPLMLLIAVVWRHRHRPLVVGLLTAVAVSIKPVVWPLALWLLVTRRWRAAAWGLASGLAINVAVWGLVGFNAIRAYLHVSSEVTTALWLGGYGVLAVAHHAGLGRTAGEVLLVVISVGVGAAVIFFGARRRNDRATLVLGIALMLIASPLVWAHYFALLLVPMAICRPRLDLVWALPILMWPLPPRLPVAGWQEVIAWTVAAAIVLLCLRARHERFESPSLVRGTAVRASALAVAYVDPQ